MTELQKFSTGANGVVLAPANTVQIEPQIKCKKCGGYIFFGFPVPEMGHLILTCGTENCHEQRTFKLAAL